MNEKDKKGYIDILRKYEEGDFNQIVNNQIQKVIKETARLVGLLEEARQVLDIDSEDFDSIRKFGSSFLHDLTIKAKDLNIQVQ